jgi:hypothetical protein
MPRAKSPRWAAYVEHLAKRTDAFAADGEREIAALQVQIEEKRRPSPTARQELYACLLNCETPNRNRLDDVAGILSLDVPPSKYAAPARQAPGQTTTGQPAADQPASGPKPSARRKRRRKQAANSAFNSDTL